MHRYVAFVIPQRDAGWIVIFPDFPDVIAKGLLIHDALGRAQRELNDRADVFRILGTPMPPPQRVAALVQDPFFRCSMVAIVAVPGPREPTGGNVFRFG